MKNLFKLSFLLLITLFAVSCERTYDAPPLVPHVYDGPSPNTTIAQIKANYASVTSTAPVAVDTTLILKAYVGGNDLSGNIYKQLVVQDGTGGISIGIEGSGLNSTYTVGQEVFIDIKGLAIVNYGGQLQIGSIGTNANRIPELIAKDHIKLNGWPEFKYVEPKVSTISSLNASDVNTVIQLDSVYFNDGGVKNYADDGQTANRTLTQILPDGTTQTIIVRTSSYATFAGQKLPTGVGTLVGVLGKFNNDYQFTIRTLKDVIGFDGKQPGGDTPSTGTGTGTQADPYNITSAIAKQGETGVWVKGYIVGSIPDKSLSEAQFTAPFTGASNVLIAASPTETDPAKCFPIQLVFGTTPRDINLKDNPGNKGKEVLLKGDLIAYFGVPAMKNTSEYVLDGTGGGTTPTPDPGTGSGTGVQTDPYDITSAIAKQGETGVWVKGYIVGSVPAAVIGDAQFTAPFTGGSNILIAASPTETDPTKCFPIQLVFGTAPRDINLKDHPENKGKLVYLKGDLTTYFGVAAMKTTSEYEFK